MRCRKVRGLIAASVYGDLTREEQAAFEGHLASCPGCRNEAAALSRVTAAIPVEAPPLDRDLLPATWRRLRESQAEPIRIPWRLAAPAGAFAVFLVLVSYIAINRSEFKGVQPRNAAVAREDEISPVQCALDEAQKLRQHHDYTTAYRTLKQAIEEYPDDAAAAEAQRLRADIAFSLLKWYPEAYEDYDLLADRYPAVFASSAESIHRRDLLAEAREKDYASLHALDAARRSTDNKFAQLENVIGRYPGTFVASSAAEDMARVIAGEDMEKGGVSERLDAMVHARDKCRNTIAKRQLDLEAGHIYHREMNDPAKARECYGQVIASDNSVLARLGRQSLAEIDARE
jgi:tetratricopeptide (TPR) repeat protein